MSESGPILPGCTLSARDITKSFGGVHALRGVSIDLGLGSVLAIAGENGAGKSTLIKILTGIHQPDGGTIAIDGTAQQLSPARAKELGIATVAQELSVLDHLSIAENITLGCEPLNRFGLVDRKKQRSDAQHLLDRLGLGLDPDDMVRDLSLANKQMVEIAKAMVTNPRILILDEPTSGLRETDVATLLGLVRQLRDEGAALVIITHRMSEIFQISDKIMVLKDGEHVGTVPTAQTSEQEIVRMMVGRDLNAVYPDKKPLAEHSDPVLSVSGLTLPGTTIRDISLTVPRGAVVALAGLAGQGQNDLLEGIAGLRPARGRITMGDRTRPAFGSVAEAAKNGVVLIPEDRKTQGLVLPMSIGQNISLPTVGRRSLLGWVRQAAENRVADQAIAQMEIRPPDATVIAGQLSGGNQQKVVISKWLVADPEVVLCADPTRGIDVGTKQEIYQLLRSLADSGVGVLMLSTDLTEVIGLADIVHVMAEGRIVATLTGQAIDEETITDAAFQGTASAGLEQKGDAA